MRFLFVLAIATAGLVLSPLAAGAQNSQQQRMKACNAEAATNHLAGADRKSFMAQCLSGGAAPALNPQQQKMKDCNAKAGEQQLTGAARKAFMSSCLRG